LPHSLWLTAGVDNFTGTSGNDTFNASPVGVTVMGLTGLIDSYIADTLDGGDGNDTLNINATSGGTFKSSNIENINIRTRAGDGVEIDMSEVTDVVNLTADALRSTLTLDEVQEISHLVYKNNARGGDSALTVTFAAETVNGDDDTLELTVDSNTLGGLVTVNGIETVNLNSIGGNLVDLSAEDALVVISGDGKLDLYADDIGSVINNATAAVILETASATTIENHGELTLVNTGDLATIVNTEDATLTVDGTGATSEITNAGTATINGTGDDVTIDNTGTMTITGTGAVAAGDVTITNTGTMIIEDSGASIIESSDGELTIIEDAFADAAEITVTGGTLDATVTENSVIIDASESDGDVDLRVNAPTAARTIEFTASTGANTVTFGAEALTDDVTLTGGEGTNTIRLEDADSSKFNFTNVTGFETVEYVGDDAVTWDTSAIEINTTFVFNAIVDADDVVGDEGANGASGDAATAAADARNGDDAVDAGDGGNGAIAVDISDHDDTHVFTFNSSLTSMGGNGSAGYHGGAGGGGIRVGTASRADGGHGGNGSRGTNGGDGVSVLSFDATAATKLNIVLNGVTLNSSGGNGGIGGNGGNGGKGAGTSTVGVDGGDGGNGGLGGAGGDGGDAGITIAATHAREVNITSNASEDGRITSNRLIADGGMFGTGGDGGLGGTGGLSSVGGSSHGANGASGTNGVVGTKGADVAGLAVADTATITIDGAADLNLGLVSGDDLTIDASAFTGDLTLTTEDGDDVITGGTGTNTITLNGGADTVDLSASLVMQDTVTVKFADGTDAESEIFVAITGLTLGDKNSGDALLFSSGQLNIVQNFNMTNGSVSTSSTPATSEVTTLSFVGMEPGETITVMDKTFIAPEENTKETVQFNFYGVVNNLTLADGDTLTVVVGDTVYNYLHTEGSVGKSYASVLQEAINLEAGWTVDGEPAIYEATGVMGKLQALEPGNLTDLTVSSIKFAKNNDTPIPYFNDIEVTDGSTPGASPTEVKEFFVANAPTGWVATDNNFVNQVVFTSTTDGNVDDLIVTGTGIAPAMSTVQGVDAGSSSDIIFSVQDGIALVTRPVDASFLDVLDTVFVDILGNNETGDEVVAFEFADATYLAVDTDGNSTYDAEIDHVVKLVGIDASSISISNGSLYVNGTHIAIA